MSKEEVLLKVLNEILKNLNKEPIDDLVKFVNIDREDIIKPINEVLMTTMLDEIYGPFDKKNTNWYGRKTSKHYILSFLRSACGDCGYNFKSTKKQISKKFEGYHRYTSETHAFYSIFKK